jgi:uncharacterized protein with PIN domain
MPWKRGRKMVKTKLKITYHCPVCEKQIGPAEKGFKRCPYCDRVVEPYTKERVAKVPDDDPLKELEVDLSEIKEARE